MRKTKKYKVYSIEEKNRIVKRYLDGEIGMADCVREYDLSDHSVLFRWRRNYLAYGTVVDRRGQKKPGGKPRGRAKKADLNSMSKEELITLIGAYEDIKKNDGLPKTTKEKYHVIFGLKHKYPIKTLCSLLKCSRSGYYDWIRLGRPVHKAHNDALSDLILNQYLSDTRQGIVQLRMNIKAVNRVSLTNKTVYRYMRLLDIRSITGRKPKKYNKIPHHEIPNLLKRDFTTTGPNQKWSIDVTYIQTSEGIEYLCVIKDLYDKSIIAYRQSRFNDNPLVIETVKEALTKVRRAHRKGLILHSDQGHQFTSIAYRRLLKRRQVRHSVSYKGSCADNVPIESWFSLLKCESLKLHRLTSRNLAKQLVSEYVIFYNQHRLQEQLKELTPLQYRQTALT